MRDYKITWLADPKLWKIMIIFFLVLYTKNLMCLLPPDYYFIMNWRISDHNDNIETHFIHPFLLPNA